MKKSRKLIIVIICILALVLLSYLYIQSKEETMQEVYSFKENEMSLYGDIISNYGGIKLLEYNKSNKDYDEIYFISRDYTTEPSIYYTVKVTDESNNNLLIDGSEEQKIVGGQVTSVKIKKNDLNDKINFAIYEIDETTEKIYNSVNKEFDLTKDLEERNQINQNVSLKDGKIGNLNFKYIDSEYVYFGTRAHAYSQNYTGENCSIPIKAQYGNYLYTEEYINITADKNVNNLSLEEAFENLKLINENMGQYGLSDVFGIDIWDKQTQEYSYTMIIDFQEMINICKGLTIEKDGKKYTKEDLNEDLATMSMVKDAEIEIGNGVRAIKYHFEYEGFIDESVSNYILVDEDYVYEIQISENARTSNISNDVLDSFNF